MRVAQPVGDARDAFKTRFENEKGTNPEELIAAAHAGCFIKLPRCTEPLADAR
jgi:organic hydroperoxide reductase OsmC/OhrA